MKKTALLFCLIASTTVFAALPPFAQSTKELKAILSDPQMQDQMGSAEFIEKIIKTDEGYIIITQHYLMHVDVHYQEAARPGPVPFELEFHKPIDLKSKE